MGSQPHRHTWEKEITHHTEKPGETGSQIIPTHLERRYHYTPHRHAPGKRGSHTPHRHTWKEGITHHTDAHGKRTPVHLGRQDQTPCRNTCRGEITYLPTLPERRDHTSYRHIWEEEITHHADTHLGRWDLNHIDTPGKRRSHTITKNLGRWDHRSYRYIWKEGITHHTDTRLERGGHTHHTDAPGERGSHITPTHLGRGDHTPHLYTWGDRITHHAENV